MSVDRPTPDTDSSDTAEIDADTRAELIELGERLTAVDGPLVGSGDREHVEELVYRLFEAVGGRRVADTVDEPVVEAVDDDTLWRKYTGGVTARSMCGPFTVDGSASDDGVDIEESFVEIVAAGTDRAVVSLDTNHRADYHGSEWEQGALHELTPRQARSLAAGLLEQAERAEKHAEEL